MKLFKNYATKKKLKEENAYLKELLLKPTQIHSVERNVEKVRTSFDIPAGEKIPDEVIKRHIANNMVQFLQPLIEYDFCNNRHGGKTYFGSLYVVNKK